MSLLPQFVHLSVHIRPLGYFLQSYKYQKAPSGFEGGMIHSMALDIISVQSFWLPFLQCKWCSKIPTKKTCGGLFWRQNHCKPFVENDPLLEWVGWTFDPLWLQDLMFTSPLTPSAPLPTPSPEEQPLSLLLPTWEFSRLLAAPGFSISELHH